MKYFLGVLGVILLVIFVIVLALRGGDDTSTPAPDVKALTEYSAEPQSQATMTTGGAINAEENHRIVNVQVTASSRSVAITEGYNGKVISEETFPNTTDAFSAFLAGLEQVGFSKVRSSKLDFTSVCPTAKRYSYVLSSNGEDVVNSWSATCERGTYGGQVTNTQNLFQAQIPNYSDIVNDVDFSLKPSS